LFPIIGIGGGIKMDYFLLGILIVLIVDWLFMAIFIKEISLEDNNFVGFRAMRRAIKKWNIKRKYKKGQKLL
jgi:hypothetical protein